MKVIVFNSGSSTLKFDLLDAPGSGGEFSAGRLAHGQIDRIGRDAELDVRASSRASMRRKVSVKDHRDAVEQVLGALREALPGGDDLGVQAVGHRVVHGGDRFVSPTLVDDSVLLALEELDELAPLHNPAAVEGIRAAREVLGSDVPMVAVFDTAFHISLPEYAYTYALPYEMAHRNKVRRYGFHGTAHEYMLKRYTQITGTRLEDATIITLQLGNGCSATAIRNGRSVDTSMGFTPLEGLVMGTRSGDLDPSIVSYLVRKEGMSAEDVASLLNTQSGLLGISGRYSDMRELLAAADEDPRARLAIEVFCYRVKKYIGAYLAALGGANAVVFGGGIGENATTIRARICEGLEWCGLRLDAGRNASTVGREGLISEDGGSMAAYVVAVDENLLIALHTVECVTNRVRE